MLRAKGVFVILTQLCPSADKGVYAGKAREGQTQYVAPLFGCHVQAL